MLGVERAIFSRFEVRDVFIGGLVREEWGLYVVEEGFSYFCDCFYFILKQILEFRMRLVGSGDVLIMFVDFIYWFTGIIWIFQMQEYFFGYGQFGGQIQGWGYSAFSFCEYGVRGRVYVFYFVRGLRFDFFLRICFRKKFEKTCGQYVRQELLGLFKYQGYCQYGRFFWRLRGVFRTSGKEFAGC